MRTEPNFGKKEPVRPQDKADPSGCIWIPLFIVASYYVLLAIVRYTSGSGSWLDKIICFGALIVFGIIMVLAAIQSAQESSAVEAQKQQWKSGCKSAEAAIVSRDGYAGGSYEDEYGIPHSVRPHYRLTLHLPDQTDVIVEIRESVYKKLENRNSVRIYYMPEKPFTFLLEEEF
jgi:hypothetical protein